MKKKENSKRKGKERKEVSKLYVLVPHGAVAIFRLVYSDPATPWRCGNNQAGVSGSS